jgi:hypothetical protein
MATVEPKSLYAVSPAEPQMTYFQVAIAQGAFADSADANGGRVSPCVANDFATKPTTLAESLKVSRGALRFKMMMESLGIRSNFKVHNIVTTYASDAGDSPITNLAFGLVFENPDFIPTTGTSIDGSSTGTKAEYIADKIGEALNTTRTENMTVYDPTSGQGLISNDAVTAGPVSGNTGTIRDAISVTEVSAFAPNTSGQLATDNSLTYSAE